MKRGAVSFRIPHAHDDILRIVAEFFTEEVQSADVLAVCVYANAQGDIVVLGQMKIGKRHVGQRLAIEQAVHRIRAMS